MNQITITVDLTARNLEILKQLCVEPETFQEKVERLGLNRPAVPTPEELAKTKAAPVQAAPAKELPQPQAEAVPQETAKKLDAKDVKAVCLKMSKAGRADELRAAFAKFGGKKFSDISEDDYPALMEELQNA